MTDRLPCKNIDCKYTILPTTATKTNGFCMPCVQKTAREEREKFIRKYRRDVNLYEGVDDLVDILYLMHGHREPDPLVNFVPFHSSIAEVYSKLDDEQISRMEHYALTRLRVDDADKAETIAGCLAAFTTGDMSALLDGFVAHNRFHPGFIFMRATPDIRDRIIARLECGRGYRTHPLSALAWIGDSKVVELFGQFRTRPPLWAEALCTSPEKYAVMAGWELSPDLSRRDLYDRSCYPLIAESKAPLGRKVAALTPRQDICPWCNLPLVNLLEFHHISERLRMSSPAIEPTRIPTCESCGGYTVIYGEMGDQGSRWSSHNAIETSALPENSFDWQGIQRERLVVDEKPRSPWHAVSYCLDTKCSQIGGHPTWIQNEEYPTCPECRQTMPFLGQISYEDIDEFGEGIHYAFLCSKCGISATTYQQT